MSARILVSAVLFIGFFCSAVNSQEIPDRAMDLSRPEVKARIDELVQPYLDSERVQGLSIGLILGDSERTLHYGSVAEGGPAPTDASVYEIGSISKVFTGLLLADAVVQGKVRLEQNAGELLPDGVAMPSKDGREIRLIDMATHRSGLPRLANNMPSLRTDNPYSDYTSDLAYAFLKECQLRHAPGDQMEYSNFAASLLGNLVCRDSGQSYDELLSQRITKKLGMDNTTVTADPAILARLVPGHDNTKRQVSTWEFADMPGAGGIRSTVPDMLKFAKANLSPPDDELGNAIELAWKQHRAGSGKEFAMGLGWHIARDGSTRWHNGQTGGYHAMLFVSRKIPAAVVLMTNTATMDVDVLAEKLIQLLAGAKVRPEPSASGKKVDTAIMKSFEGKYQLAPQVIFTVTVVKDRLMVGLTGQPTFQVYAKSDYEWEYRVVPATLTFKKGSDGKASEVVLFQNGIRQTAKRID